MSWKEVGIVFFTATWCLCAGSYDIASGQCIWYDICAENPNITNPGLFGSNGLNCLYDGEAIKLDEEYKELLRTTCPEMAADIEDSNGDMFTCCSGASIDDLHTQLRLMEQTISRCPACVANLKLDFCYFACHPDQSSFLVPSELYTDDEGVVSVWTVDFYMHSEYRDNTFYSCENVYYPALSGPSMDTLCGEWGAEYCTPERLFNYFGANDLAPFPIYYKYVDEPLTVISLTGEEIEITPFNLPTIPCNTTNSDYSCSCTDCIESCPTVEPEIPEEPSMVGDLRTYVFILIMCFALFATAVLILLLIMNYNWILFSSAMIEKLLRSYFYTHGKLVANHPYITLVCGAIVVIVLCCGLSKVEITNDPVELWAGEDSDSRKQKEYFDEKFGPFYRTTQIIFTAPTTSSFESTITFENAEVPLEFGGIFEKEIMNIGIDLQLAIMEIEADYEGKNVTLSDICSKPLAPSDEDCLIESIYNYWQNDKDKMQDEYIGNEYLSTLITCINNPTYIETSQNKSCLGTYGGVIFPYVALGGYLNDNQNLNDNPAYQNSTAIVITFLNENYVDDSDLGEVLAWEKAFIEFMDGYSNSKIEVAYYTERSIEDQIREIGESDVWTVVISYLIMFAYISFSLGASMSCGDTAWVNMKVSLGFGGVVLVLLSVFSANGIAGYAGLKNTVFVLEVVPFITLAVGVDNIFLLVQTWQRLKRGPEETIENHIGRVAAAVGPSMILATTAEVVCFFLGSLSKMPAVYTFALNAGIALVIDFLLQITCFIALLTLDAYRVESSRYDVAYCIKASNPVEKKQTNIFEGFFEKLYGPFLMNNFVRSAVLIIFAASATTSGIYIPKLGIGLDQNIAMPDGSYVLKYFEYLEDYLSVGSPIYFVMTEGYDYTQYDMQNLVCSQNGCDENSMLSQIYYASLTPQITTVATGASSWLEPYFSYVADEVGSKRNVQQACCRLDENGTFISTSEPIAEEANTTCLQEYQLNDDDRPRPAYFMKNLPYYLIDNPHGLYCAQAGHPAYGDAVRIIEENNSTAVGANSFMAYHTILSTSVEFTEGVRQAYKLCDQITEYLQENSGNTEVEVFPYSIFYVYYEQYLDMWDNAKHTLFISLGALFVVMTLATGFDVLSAFINLIIIFLILVNVMGCMYAWNIELNAVSLVNLVMVSGISVEFCAHFTRAFNLRPYGDRKTRVIETLATTGASIMSGIAITKLAGIIVLGFANSQVFVIYYFRMFLLMVIFAVTHGLILLPVLLSFIGNAPNPYLLPQREAVSNGDVKLSVVQNGKEKYEENGMPNNGYASDGK